LSPPECYKDSFSNVGREEKGYDEMKINRLRFGQLYEAKKKCKELGRD
jgi:hypothetical protein